MRFRPAARRPDGRFFVPLSLLAVLPACRVSPAGLNDAGGTETGEATPEFRWRALPLPPPEGPFLFDLEIFSDREGTIFLSYPGLEESRQRATDPLPFSQPMRWRVIARAANGAVDTVSGVGPFVVTSGTNPPVPTLCQSFPNPFPSPEAGAGGTMVWFDLARRSEVELAVFDLRGHLARRLIPGPGCAPRELPAGIHGREVGGPGDPCVLLARDGRDDGGRQVPRGVYLLRLKAGGTTEVRTMVFWP